MMSSSDDVLNTPLTFPAQTHIKEEGSPATQGEDASISLFPSGDDIISNNIQFLAFKVKIEPLSEDEQDGEQTSTVDHPLGILIKREKTEVDTPRDYSMEGDINQRKNSGDDSHEAETNGHSMSLLDCALVKCEKDGEPDTEISESYSMYDLNEVANKKKQISKKHIKSKAENTCSVCGKDFDKSDTCLQHMWDTHTGEEKHTCKLCGKAFERRFDLKRHELTHSNARPHSCDVCDKSFKQKGHLSKHKKTCHSHERPFSCNLCEKNFKQKDHLDKHKKTCHSDERPFSCDLCDKSFKQKAHLYTHKAFCHSEERPFSCDLCEQTFKLKPLLQRHKDTCH